MYPADMPLLLAVEFICGAAGALAVRWLCPGIRFGRVATAVVGMIGGYGFTLLAGRVPGIGRFVGQMETAADAAIRGTGGFTPSLLIGVGVSGLLGGSLLALILAFLRRSKGTDRWQT